ncbi:MAG: hypothetical protein WA956_07280 [Stenotrophomonas sp.]
MSRNSKAKRDQRKKQQAHRPFLRLDAQQQVQNHAVLADQEGRVVAAIGLQGRQWLLSMGGQTMGNADNPVPMLAMLKHLSNVQAKEGRNVNLEYSPLLQQLLDALAAEQGVSADDYLAAQVAEFENVEGEDVLAAADNADADADDAGTSAETTADGAAETADGDKPQA